MHAAAAAFAVYALGCVTDLLGGKLVVEITPTVVKCYQTDRLAEKAGPKTINNEVLLLLRLCGDQGDLIRARLRREKAMKLTTPPSPGRAYTSDEKARMLAEAAKLRSKNMYPALVVDLNCGLRDKELRELRWQQIDLVHKKTLTVGKSKTEAGAGRVIPLNDTVLVALEAHAAWYIRRFGECKPEWYVFPAGKKQPNEPARAVIIAVGLIQKLMPQTHAALSGRGALCGALEDIENTGPAGVIGGHDAQ